MILTFDIGGTSIKYGCMKMEKEKPVFVTQEEIASDAKKSKGPGILRTMERLSEEVMRTQNIEGIAISTAGMVDEQAGRILYANENIPEYTGMPIKELLEERFHIPVWVENDVNAAALGEARFGAGANAEDVFMVTIGTGIGGAIICNHELYHGSNGSAGEIGYMLVDGKEFQDIASTSALVEMVNMAYPQQDWDGRRIFAQAKQQDAVCMQAIDTLCERIVKGLSTCICLLNPQVVILGGGIMSQEAYLAPIMEHYMKKYVKETMRTHTTLVFAKLGNRAGMAGAFAYWLQKEGKCHA